MTYGVQPACSYRGNLMLIYTDPLFSTPWTWLALMPCRHVLQNVGKPCSQWNPSAMRARSFRSADPAPDVSVRPTASRSRSHRAIGAKMILLVARSMLVGNAIAVWPVSELDLRAKKKKSCHARSSRAAKTQVVTHVEFPAFESRWGGQVQRRSKYPARFAIRPATTSPRRFALATAVLSQSRVAKRGNRRTS